jgi:hypothetical protein
MDGVGHNQGVVTAGKGVFENVSFHDTNTRPLGLLGQFLTRDRARSRQVEQCTFQGTISPEHRNKE